MSDVKFIIIVDTAQYAGNFERELCAYASGQIGECSVGRDEVDEEMPNFEWWEDNVEHQPDENGCYRPVEIYPNPRWTNDGYGNHTLLKEGEARAFVAYNSIAIALSELPTSEIWAQFKQRAKEFCCRKGITIEGFRWVKEDTVTTTIFEELEA
jgi:hypothetical protein